jgi:hypothetical protein
MDPMKALADLDNAVSRVAMDREAHAHFVFCVSTLRAALAQGCPPQGDTSDRGPGA